MLCYIFEKNWIRGSNPEHDDYFRELIHMLFPYIYCKDENSDHKVGIYCNLIGPLDQS